MTVKSLDELAEVASRVVGARRGLWMVLNPENRQLAVPDAFDGAIIEVKVRHLKFFATWHVLTASCDCKSV